MRGLRWISLGLLVLVLQIWSLRRWRGQRSLEHPSNDRAQQLDADRGTLMATRSEAMVGRMEEPLVHEHGWKPPRILEWIPFSKCLVVASSGRHNWRPRCSSHKFKTRGEIPGLVLRQICLTQLSLVCMAVRSRVIGDSPE